MKIWWERVLFRSSRVAFSIGFINYLLFLLSSFMGILFEIDNYFILFSGTGLIEALYIFLTDLDFVILTRRTSTNGRTLTIHFFTSTVIVFAIFRAVTSILIYFVAIDEDMLFFEGLFINGLCLIYYKVSCILIILCV